MPGFLMFYNCITRRVVIATGVGCAPEKMGCWSVPATLYADLEAEGEQPGLASITFS